MPSVVDTMTAEVLAEAQVAARAMHDAFEPEVRMWVQDAIADMLRVGVDESVFSRESPYFYTAKAAIVLNVKAHFGIDNPNAEADFYLASYRQHVIDLLNSAANIAAKEEPDAVE